MSERANPETCLHRVIELDHNYESAVYACSSCDSLIKAEHWEGRLYKHLPQFERWEQVGPSPRKRN